MTPVAQSQDKALETQAVSQPAIVEIQVVSPDGKTIANVYNISGDSQQTVVSPFGKVELTTILKLKNTAERIAKLHWLNPDRILVSADYLEHLGGSLVSVIIIFCLPTKLMSIAGSQSNMPPALKKPVTLLETLPVCHLLG
ncbi:hypothetical protein [Idiomarina aquatica]|uniref:Uncharacterized protein n=1 Tax=Idiomarina aquatica TaxID=1327752 RepID=A0AA94EHE4_9GAMM|nr:hypothetical protein [Idiomarina aquatica]RUO45050.1 hypothetical protein CWE23_03240 [Idiomarina aquatica]